MTDLLPESRLTLEQRNERDQRDLNACVALVTKWMARADDLDMRAGRTAAARKRRLATVIEDSGVAKLTMELTDEVLRIADPLASATHFAHVVKHATFDALPPVDRLLLRVGAAIAPRAPRVVMPLVVKRLRRETTRSIVSADPARLAVHRRVCEQQGFRMNVNRLGEAILGHDEASSRLQAVIDLIERGGSNAVSVKLSAVVANISALAFDDTVDRIVTVLRPLYRAAVKNTVFVNLDMEEYRDLDLTCEVFMRILSEVEFTDYCGGIVLQAYLPDAHSAAERLGDWARARVATGGSPIRIRLVKGANLAMETVDAEMHGWPTATYPTKADVDASWKRLLDSLLDARFDSALVVGVASHNLFDVAWAVNQQERLAKRGMAHRLRFEMLQGMAEAQAQAVIETTGDLLMYTPTVAPTDFVAAIGYLTRRLDENTGPENFLRALVNLKAGTPEFERQRERFAAAVVARHSISTESFRQSDPNNAPAPTSFANADDTDMTRRSDRNRLLEAVAVWQGEAPPLIATSTSEVDGVVSAAVAGGRTWVKKSDAQRADHLRAVGRHIAEHRADTVALLAHTASKTILEGDLEVSEAIDFANYYADRAEELVDHPSSSALGVVVVAPPWNFPYAITMGGVLASLAAGNAVILKPTPQCPRVAASVARHCWEAGIPSSVLHLLAVPDNDIGRHLITHDGVDAVILTGSAETAYKFLEWKPSLRLLAETSGKNSMIVTPSADLDLAIKDLVKSAFGHAGQKCSAASLAIVDQRVYDDAMFARRLADAVRTLTCGPSTDPRTDVAPLVEAPTANLLRALTQLDAGETWLVKPVNYDATDPSAWTPGVRLGVKNGSWFHLNECFGPVLGVMRADDLDDAIALQNSVPFGLTAGIHCLDDVDVRRWADRVEAGNLYVNRTITGAVVRRQPFGGWKRSSVGPGAKAGGPSYVHVLRRWAPGLTPSGLDRLNASSRQTYDPSALVAEINMLRYRPLDRGVVVYIGVDVPIGQRQLVDAAAQALACATIVFVQEESSDQRFAEQGAIAALVEGRADRLRIIGSCTDDLRRAAHGAGVRVDDDLMSDDPAIELVRFMREQVVAITQHRHGRPRPMTLV
jgi:RHH-type transcriptional regulator, proline utilization regulon repressor / proline dehydrogenase / delta 1-pyrroline-5-carboxylate dehydrogenase